MTSPLIQRILSQMVQTLVARGQLVLIEGASPAMVSAALGESVSSAPGFSQFGSWLSGALLANDAVEELYATDAELAAMLRGVEL